MIQTQIIRFLQMVGLVLLQVLVCNHIHIFGFATPMVYVALLLYFPADASRNSILLWSFGIGLVADIFDNTPGMAAASMTFVGLVQPVLIGMMLPKDRAEDTYVTFRTMGVLRHATYVFLLSLLHCTLYFILEDFAFHSILATVLSVVGSTLVTVFFVLLLELYRG